ncbi:MAG: hypothetical protein V3V56_01245 [bacterium]
MLRLYLTRLVLPFVFVAAMISIPFLWFPDVEGPPGGAPGGAPGGIAHMPFPGDAAGGDPAASSGGAGAAGGRRTPFQKTMTLGFALILISVTAGGVMLYGITRRQTVSFRRRFAPKKSAGKKSGKETPPA